MQIISQARRNDVRDLLQELRENVIFTDVATIPIPLYQKIKEELVKLEIKEELEKLEIKHHTVYGTTFIKTWVEGSNLHLKEITPSEIYAEGGNDDI
jgi:hypothetical protein